MMTPERAIDLMTQLRTCKVCKYPQELHHFAGDSTTCTHCEEKAKAATICDGMRRRFKERRKW